MSGLRLNIDKSEGLWFGSDKKTYSLSVISLVLNGQRCLGIYLGHDKQINDKKIFEDKVDSIEVILKKLEKRDLTLFGRVLVLKNCALSKLIGLLPVTTVCIPSNYIIYIII